MTKTVKAWEVTNEAADRPVIMLTRGFSWWKDNAEQFTEKVSEMLSAGITRVKLYINSPGGSLWEASEIANQCARFADVEVELGALCASAATVVACRFKRVEAAKNMQWMMHDPILTPTISKESDIESAKQLYQNLREMAINSYKEKSGLSGEEISAMMAATTWLNAKQAKEKGFVDVIKGEEDSMPDDAVAVLESLNAVIPEAINFSFQKPNHTDNSMKEIAKKLGLPENATEAQMVAKLDADTQAATEAMTEATNALVEMAEARGLKAETIRTLAAKDFKATMELVKATPAKGAEGVDEVRMSDILEALKGTKEPEVKMTFGEMLEKAPEKLVELAAKPEAFAAAFAKEYGYTPEPEEVKEFIKTLKK